MTHTARSEVRGTIETRASDAEIDSAILTAAVALNHPEIIPDFALRGCDDDHPVWDVIDAAVLALRPRIAVVVTDLAVMGAGGLFDPGSISRFIVEHAADDLRAEIFLVVDPLDKNIVDLIEWAREHRFKIAGISATRVTGISQYARIIDGILRRSYELVVVADPYYESSDPRVTVHRRVTR